MAPASPGRWRPQLFFAAAALTALQLPLAAGQPVELPTLATTADEPEEDVTDAAVNATNATNATVKAEGPPAEKLSSPKAYGHTSKVHPYNGHRDRAWYVESRWGPDKEYKVQDGPITALPKPAPPRIPTFVRAPKVKAKRARFPDSITDEHPRGSPRNRNGHDEVMDGNQPEVPMWGRGVNNSMDVVDDHLNGENDIAPISWKEPSKEDAVSESNTPASRSAANSSDTQAASSGNNGAKKKKPDAKEVETKPLREAAATTTTTTTTEVKYALQKPQGHTSLVHPTKGNSDREWYVDGRMWGAGPHKPQDGPITALPKEDASATPPAPAPAAPQEKLVEGAAGAAGAVPVDPKKAKEVGSKAPESTENLKDAVQESVEEAPEENIAAHQEFSLTRTMKGETVESNLRHETVPVVSPRVVPITPKRFERDERERAEEAEKAEGVVLKKEGPPSLPSMGASFLSIT